MQILAAGCDTPVSREMVNSILPLCIGLCADLSVCVSVRNKL
jgi:hypothetical protein